VYSCNISYFPADGNYVALYLQHLSEAKGSKSAVEEAVNSLAWVHGLVGLTTPTASPIVRVTLEENSSQTSPFTIEMLRAIVDDATNRNTLTSIRLATACLLAFSGFLRFDEVANIRPCDLIIGSHHLTIKISHSKSDQLRNGDKVVIARKG